jgi:hypothetical protein
MSKILFKILEYLLYLNNVELEEKTLSTGVLSWCH